jgi:hypothetical protein
LANPEAAESDLIIYSDAPRSPAVAVRVQQVRDYCRDLQGFSSIRLIESATNRGLSGSIIGGVTETLAKYEKAIIIEDDLVLSPHFLRFMNDGLTTYCDDDLVASIHGYCYPVRQSLPETFFLRGADCWGWAVWRRSWRLFQPDGAVLLQELESRDLTRRFDLGGAMGFTQMLRDQIAGRNDSWAIRWHASCFLKGCMTLYPGRSMVANVGLDGSGVHCGADGNLVADVSLLPVKVDRLPISEDQTARACIADHLARGRQRHSTVRRMLSRLLMVWR